MTWRVIMSCLIDNDSPLCFQHCKEAVSIWRPRVCKAEGWPLAADTEGSLISLQQIHLLML